MFTVNDLYIMNDVQRNAVFCYLKKMILEDALINQKKVFGLVSENVLKIQNLIKESIVMVDGVKEDGVIDLNIEMLKKLKEAYKYSGESFEGVSDKLAVNYENIIYEVRDRGEIVENLKNNDVFVCSFRLGIKCSGEGKFTEDMCCRLLNYINEKAYGTDMKKVFYEDVSSRAGGKGFSSVEFLFFENIFIRIDSKEFLLKVREIFGSGTDVVTSDHTLKPFMPLFGNGIDFLMASLSA